MSRRDRASTSTIPGSTVPGSPIAPRPGGLAAHDTDVVGLLFGLTFLVCAALAVAVRTGSLGFGSDQPTGGWIAGALLAVVGLAGVIGTLATLRRRASGPPAEPVLGSGDRDVEADETEVLDPPGVVEE